MLVLTVEIQTLDLKKVRLCWFQCQGLQHRFLLIHQEEFKTSLDHRSYLCQIQLIFPTVYLNDIHQNQVKLERKSIV